MDILYGILALQVLQIALMMFTFRPKDIKAIKKAVKKRKMVMGG